MIGLGIIDPDVTPTLIDDYFAKVKAVTRQDWGKKLRGEENDEWVSMRPSPTPNEMTVREVQTVLRDSSFFPEGTLDGICGYRTTAAIRLFQEYVRCDDPSIGVPDGVAGPKTFGHLAAWRDSGRKADWADTLQAWKAGSAGGEYREWLALLEAVKQRYLTQPNAMLRAVNTFPGKSDTRKVADWDFDPRHVHIVGVRRMDRHLQAPEERKFNDVITLLVRGLVFKFQGSTDPGKTKNPRGAPFLTQGQHDYHFGWHLISASNKSHQALKPESFMTSGVLAVRSNDFVLTDEDLATGLETVNDINVHWGGAGGTARFVKGWSEGCQVITGVGYINHNGRAIDCSSFAAPTTGNLSEPGKTRGAYNVLSDLVATLGGHTGGKVRYTLLGEDDLKLSPAVATKLAEAIEIAKQKV